MKHATNIKKLGKLPKTEMNLKKGVRPSYNFKLNVQNR